MKARFKYLAKVEFLDSFEIEDIGNFVLRGFDDFGNKYMMIIRTVLGVSRVIQIGPISDSSGTECFCSFLQRDYDDYKMNKMIEKFISRGKDLTQIEIFHPKTKSEFKEYTKDLPNLVEKLYD